MVQFMKVYLTFSKLQGEKYIFPISDMMFESRSFIFGYRYFLLDTI